MSQVNPLDKLSEAYNTNSVTTKGAATMNTIATQNKTAAKSAAIDAVGRAGNTAVITAIKPHLPMMIKGYAEHPMANIIAANLVNAAVQQTGVGGEKGRIVANAMIQSAYLDLARNFDIEKIVEDFLGKVPAQAVEALKATAE